MASRGPTTSRGIGTRSQNNRNILGLKIQNENLSRPPLARKPGTTNLLKDTTNRVLGLKRKAENTEDEKRMVKKRSAFGDITNAFEKNTKDGKKPAAQKEKILRNVSNNILKSNVAKPSLKEKVQLKINNQAEKVEAQTKGNVEVPKKMPLAASKKITVEGPKKMAVDAALKGTIKAQKKEELRDLSFCDSLPSSQETVLSQGSNKSDNDANKTDLDDSAAYITASEGSPIALKLNEEAKLLPEGVDDYDKEMEDDLHAVSIYAQEIFKYYRERENAFSITKYISTQPDVSKSMRSILVDWMVEVQESFELNHETLYLAVKIVDLYLSKTIIKRDQLQLLGSTALFIACKFDERTPPYADDFLYICDDAYKRKELISMEIEVLKVIGFDLGIPLSYRFLRRYARCGKVSMKDLTLTRFILEMSLMDYELIDASDSALAAAALFLARIIVGEPTWTPTLQYYSGYEIKDLYHLVYHLHRMITQPPNDSLKTIRNKYSHKVFFEVAKIPIPETLEI